MKEISNIFLFYFCPEGFLNFSNFYFDIVLFYWKQRFNSCAYDCQKKHLKVKKIKTPQVSIYVAQAVKSY